ncbi:hypothetical protein [Actinacidiphila oryziradicis]|uniref:Uncharacterized protein n=1 Tax=Actinacidiphila oryziradicis TaxID=2571141 RepID=A0A4U0RRF1_9ACTN|nr:hypothetical protein [Actinacidiphila oryziradicis]TJZ97947.1 hypothetical protein FCI23_48840 [Actinacidiphila oryziradicis]
MRRPGRSPFDRVADVNKRITSLPKAEREVFEDAVLQLVRTKDKIRKAYENSPASVPYVTTYAGNAYERELSRESTSESDVAKREQAKPEASRPEPARPEVPKDDSALHALPDFGPDLPNGQTLWDAAKANLALQEQATATIVAADAQQFAAFRQGWERPATTPESAEGRTTAAFRTLRGNETYNAQGFNADERLPRASTTADSPTTPGDASPDTTGGPGVTLPPDRRVWAGSETVRVVSRAEEVRVVGRAEDASHGLLASGRVRRPGRCPGPPSRDRG